MLESRFGVARRARKRRPFGLPDVVALAALVFRHPAELAARVCRVKHSAGSAPGQNGVTLWPVRILLIEDDARLAEHTAEYLTHHDAQVEVASDGERGLVRARSGEHDLVLLDLMLPKLDGIELCKQLRSSSNVPVIMLTARGDEVDRIVGLELGADDYLAKPFSPRELLARIRAVLRRHQAPAPASAGEPSAELRVDDLVINRDRRTADFRGERVELTAFQFDLLWVLAQSARKVLGRGEIHTAVRELRGEPPSEFDPAIDRSIDVHLSKIRSALTTAHDDAAKLIQTVRGVGYVLGAE